MISEIPLKASKRLTNEDGEGAEIGEDLGSNEDFEGPETESEEDEELM